MTVPLVFITGASSGIGQALALRYHRAGWRLALVARRSQKIHEWLRSAGIDSDRAAVYSADVRDCAAIAQAGRDCIARQGLPDVVIANAGISLGVDSAEFEDLQVMRAIFETNTLGTAATFQPFIRPLCERGRGILVGVSSVAGIRGLPGHGAYCSSKAAVISYCESLRGECRAAGVRVVTLVPGYVDTPLTRGNRYPMPFIMSAEAFAERAFRVIGKGRRYRVIPWQMGLVAWVLRGLPNTLFDGLLVGRARKSRPTSR